jgi:glycosyltransferase involved in cell wall biosynthesis
MQATVLVPTYNESANLEAMLRALAGVLREGDRVLVIDDNSPDGTGEIADRLAEKLSFVEVLHRDRKEGLGPAYVAGFRRVLAEGAELILEMDCDFSHDPADVPRLIAAAEEGADLVLGSRYVEGGRVGNWGILRRADVRQRPDVRFQVLPPPRARDARSRRDHEQGLRVPDRDDVPREARGLQGRRAPDHIRRPHRRELEDEQGDRARGGLASPAPPARQLIFRRCAT